MFNFWKSLQKKSYLQLTIPGKPQAKQRPRFTSRGGSRAYTPNETSSYEELAKWKAREAVAKVKAWRIEGVFELEIVAYFEIPPSWPKWMQESAQEGAYDHASYPDWDNIAKAVCDGLNGILWADDRLIRKASLEKRYTAGEPRAEVTVTRKDKLTFQTWKNLKKAISLKANN